MPYLRRRSFGLTDVGRRRPHNEDAFLADDTLGLYVVADGVGGQAKGEVASAEAVEEVRNFVGSAQPTLEAVLRAGGHAAASEEERTALRRLLESAVQSACYLVFGIAEQDPEGRGMSTTLSALLVVADVAVIAQVGDSRVYRHRDGRALQLTDDHTLVNHKVRTGQLTPEQAAVAAGRNVITRAVGHRDYVEVDTFEGRARPGDTFLLCSDGLHGYLDPHEVAPLFAEPSLEASARAAITLANDRGGKDNITAVIVSLF